MPLWEGERPEAFPALGLIVIVIVLLCKKGVEALPTAFEIGEPPISFQGQRLLQRCDPIEDQPELTGGESPLSGGNFGSDGLCQWERASRSRQRRSQWRCCRTIVCTSR